MSIKRDPTWKNQQKSKTRKLTNAIVEIRITIRGGVVQSVDLVDADKVKQSITVSIRDYDNADEVLDHSVDIFMFDPKEVIPNEVHTEG